MCYIANLPRLWDESYWIGLFNHDSPIRVHGIIQVVLSALEKLAMHSDPYAQIRNVRLLTQCTFPSQLWYLFVSILTIEDHFMPKRHRGRPQGQTGQAPILKPEEIKRLFRLAKSRPRMSMKAEIALCLSLYLGLRAKEIASLRSGDVFDENGGVRDVLHLRAAYTKGAKTRNVFLAAPKLRQ